MVDDIGFIQFPFFTLTSPVSRHISFKCPGICMTGPGFVHKPLNSHNVLIDPFMRCRSNACRQFLTSSSPTVFFTEDHALSRILKSNLCVSAEQNLLPGSKVPRGMLRRSLNGTQARVLLEAEKKSISMAVLLILDFLPRLNRQ